MGAKFTLDLSTKIKNAWEGEVETETGLIRARVKNERNLAFPHWDSLLFALFLFPLGRLRFRLLRLVQRQNDTASTTFSKRWRTRAKSLISAPLMGNRPGIIADVAALAWKGKPVTTIEMLPVTDLRRIRSPSAGEGL
jgi:hypothetical protein